MNFGNMLLQAGLIPVIIGSATPNRHYSDTMEWLSPGQSGKLNIVLHPSQCGAHCYNSKSPLWTYNVMHVQAYFWVLARAAQKAGVLLCGSMLEQALILRY